MKKLLSVTAFAALFSLGLTAVVSADAAKETTVKGTAKCAKCALHETEKCTPVIMVKEGDKEVEYTVTGKEAAALHKEICKGEKENVTVTGAVTEKDGKKSIAATKVE